jgi:hypothetical protein
VDGQSRELVQGTYGDGQLEKADNDAFFPKDQVGDRWVDGRDGGREGRKGWGRGEAEGNKRGSKGRLKN